MESKKEEERRCLDALLTALGREADSITPSEAPDFFLDSADQRIGVEVTAFHSVDSTSANVPRRVVEAQWEELQRAITEKRPDSLSNVSLLMMFKNMTLPRRRNRDAFIKQLIAFVEEQNPALGDATRVFNAFPEAYDLLSEYIRKLYLRRIGAWIEWDSNIHAGPVGANESDLIEAIKDKAVHDRPADLNEFWLLIFCGWRISQSAGWLFVETLKKYDSLTRLLESSNFDRVFIYDWTDERLLEWSRGNGWAVRAGALEPGG